MGRGRRAPDGKAAPLPPRAPFHPPPARESALSVSVRSDVSQRRAWQWGGGREGHFPPTPLLARPRCCLYPLASQLVISLSSFKRKVWSPLSA